MTITYNKPKLADIKSFTDNKSVDNWLPNLFGDQYYNNLFPITSDGNLDQNTQFSKNLASFEEFGITLKRYTLFLYCLKANPYFFENASKLINYNNDEFLFTPDLTSYLQSIQTNEKKNEINSSLTIELVKKYAIDKGLDFIPQKLSDYFDIAKTEDFINTVARTINPVLYESVIKHNLYVSLKDKIMNFVEDSAANWIDRAAKLNSGEFEYFIDIEGGPDNKSYPVVCVLTKRINSESKENVLKQSNSFVSNVFGKDIGSSCLARVIGTSDQFENNYKSVPILKGRKNNLTYYNSICVVYDLSRIILSTVKERSFNTQSLAEVALGFATKYYLQVDNIDFLSSRKESLTGVMENYFNEDSFSEVGFKILSAEKHSTEIYSRINLENKQQIKNSISSIIKIKRQNLVSAFSDYVDLLINLYKQNRQESIYLSAYSQKDYSVVFHFDSFLNLLAISCLPKEKEKTSFTKEFSPFVIESFDSFGKGILEQKYISDQFYSKYLNLDKSLNIFTGNRICTITKTLEKYIFDNFDASGIGSYTTPNLTTDMVEKKQSIDLITKINTTLPGVFEYSKGDFFNDDVLKDKTVKIISLNTNYRENKYQSLALQTMAFYLINAESGISLLGNDNDIKKFATLFHYPVLSITANTEQDNLNLKIGEIPKFPDFEIPQDVLLVSADVQKAFEFFKGMDFSVNDFINDVTNTTLSGVPCLADIIDTIQEFVYAIKSIDSKDGILNLVSEVISLLSRLPISELISQLLLLLLNKLAEFGENKDPCKKLPPKLSIDPDEIFNGYEYLKEVYYRSLNPDALIRGIITEIPKLPTLDFWKPIFIKILLFAIKEGILYVLRLMFQKLKPQIDKLCTADYLRFDFDINLLGVDNASFEPALIADNFGAPVGSGDSVFYDVQLSIDINQLIDLSGIVSREEAYSKICDEYNIPKNNTSLQELAKFLSDISPSVDLYELASLLRGLATDTTVRTLLDSISFTDASFKKLFLNEDETRSLFVFLSSFCDYRICYDILSKSLEKYVGNVCAPQKSKKKDYQLLLSESLGEDGANNVLRDQLNDLEKQLDSLCATKFEVNVDLLTNGPKLLANYLTPFMVMPISTIVDFQEKVYLFENDPKKNNPGALSDDQIKLLGSTLYVPSILDTFYNSFKNKNGKVRLNNTSLGITKELNGQPRFDTWNKVYKYVTTENPSIIDSIKNSKNYIDRKNELKNYFTNIGIKVEDKTIEDKLASEFIVDNFSLASKIYWRNLFSKDSFIKAYEEISYTTNYINELKNKISEDIENATNTDLNDSEDLYMSYMNKLNNVDDIPEKSNSDLIFNNYLTNGQFIFGLK